ncbi:tetratricopeptide repeat protein [Edaphocola flava]|uniref:tetratricopeptide repeat protein n=1 Tax=Edaphocola flava TaxID=2499629 RepID=UPI00100B0782|nr:hypothetical protein [Edaphocola flava]
MDNTIKIIFALGAQWKLLITLFIITVVILKWKTIWKLASSLTQVKFKTGNNEVEIHRETIKEETKITSLNNEINTETTTTVTETTETIKVLDDSDSDLGKYYKAFFAKDFATANKLFDQVANQLNGDYTSAKIRHNYRLHIYGDKEAFANIEKLSNTLTNDEHKSLALYYLGHCFESTNSKKGIELINQALQLSKVDQMRGDCIVSLSKLYISIHDSNEAIDVILNNINSISESSCLVRLYESLGKAYTQSENVLFATLAYQKASELSPNAHYLIFQAAYSCARIDSSFQDLSLLLYKNLVSLDSKHTSGYNNLGVTFSNLGLNCKSVNSYKKSFEQGETLGGSNLANRLIEAGFSEEAEKYLNIEKTEGSDNPKEVDDNVYKSLAYLKTTLQEENEKEEKFIKSAKKKYQFFSEYSNALFSEHNIDINRLTLRRYNNPVEVEKQDNIIKFSWIINTEEHHSITGTLSNGAFVGKYYKPERTYAYIGEAKYKSKIIDLYGFFDSSNNIHILTCINTENEYFLIENSPIT